MTEITESLSILSLRGDDRDKKAKLVQWRVILPRITYREK